MKRAELLMGSLLYILVAVDPSHPLRSDIPYSSEEVLVVPTTHRQPGPHNYHRVSLAAGRYQLK